MKIPKIKKFGLTAYLLTIWAISGCSLNPTRPYVDMDAAFKTAPQISPFYDSYWLLQNDLIFEAVRKSDGEIFKVTVPAGFVTDLASIPVPLNLIYDKTGRYSSAGILHDYLYWIQACDRKPSDRLIKEGLKAIGTGYFTRNTIKYGVYWFGWVAWNSNAKAKLNGEERYLPPEKRTFPPETLWSVYKNTLGNKVVPPWKLPDDSNKQQIERGICEVFNPD